MKTGLIGTAVLAASVALAGCATSPGYGSGYGNSGYGNSGYGRPANCYDCGTVTRIETVRGLGYRLTAPAEELGSEAAKP